MMLAVCGFGASPVLKCQPAQLPQGFGQLALWYLLVHPHALGMFSH